MSIYESIESNDSRRHLKLRSPVTLELTGELICANAEDVANAIVRARGAQPAWAATPMKERAALVERALKIVIERQDEIIDTARELMFEGANTVFFAMGNDESAATEAWKKLKAASLPNVYILEGGVNNWIRTFGNEDFVQENLLRDRDNDQPAFRFDAAIGARHPAAEPNPYAYEIEFEPKVKLELKRAPTSGGCG